MISSRNSVFRSIAMIRIVCVILCVSGYTSAWCQDISSFKGAKALKVSGSIHAGLFSMQSSDSSVPPVGYQSGINLNFSIFQNFNIPLSLSYSNRSSDFQTATFRRLGISPSYKWLKIHAGYRSYVLNQFLLSGKTIVGGGLELSPKKFHFLAFAGKVDDPYSIGNDYIFEQSLNEILYQRWMYGVKLGFGPEKNRIAISALKTTDKADVKNDSLSRLGLTPRENLALSLDMNNTLFKIVNFQLLVATSAMTSDRFGRPVETNETGQKWIENLSFLTSVNESTRWSFAGRAALSVRIKNINVGLKYENTQPHYAVLGVSFIQNNFENYLIDLNGVLFKKLSFFSSFGINNVNKAGFTGKPQKRTAISANLNWPISKKMSLSGTYTNFVQKPQAQLEQVLDTFAITANNVGYNFGIDYKIGGLKSKRSLTLYYSDMTFDILGFEKVVSTNQSSNVALNYKYNPKDKWNYGAGFQYNINQLSASTNTRRYGLLAHIQKTFKSSFNIRIDGGYRLNQTNESKDGRVINYGASLSYTLAKKHRLSLAFSQIHRQTTILQSKDVSNFRTNYIYSF